jgi:hypothetical protein
MNVLHARRDTGRFEESGHRVVDSLFAPGAVERPESARAH